MTVTHAAKRPTNRGELRELLNAQRNDDGTWRMPRCPKCGASDMAIVYAKSAGLTGDITHLLEGGAVGCVTTVDAAIADALGNPQPVVVEEPVMPAIPKVEIAPPGPYDHVQYIGFHVPVNFTSAATTFWSRLKSQGYRITDITDVAVVFSSHEHELEVSRHNVAYIKRKVRN